MTVQPSDLYDVLKKVRYDLTACQAKLSDAFRYLDALGTKDMDRPVYPCDLPTCGLIFDSRYELESHAYVSHGGPLPEAERLLDERVEAAARARRREMVEEGGWRLPDLADQLALHGADEAEVRELVALAHEQKTSHDDEPDLATS